LLEASDDDPQVLSLWHQLGARRELATTGWDRYRRKGPNIAGRTGDLWVNSVLSRQWGHKADDLLWFGFAIGRRRNGLRDHRCASTGKTRLSQRVLLFRQLQLLLASLILAECCDVFRNVTPVGAVSTRVVA